jgi:hypothetical protein
MNLFAPAQNQVFAQHDGASADGQRAAVHEFGARLRQRAFVEGGKALVQFPGQNQLQHGVPQKFQALIVFSAGILFVGNGRMRQRHAQQFQIAKLVTEPDLECSEVGHEVGNGVMTRRPRARSGPLRLRPDLIRALPFRRFRRRRPELQFPRRAA